MTDTVHFELPEELARLQAGGAVYRFVVETGTVVDTPTGTDHSISFFLKQDNEQENDLTMQTSMKAREGHRVSVLYVAKGEDAVLAHAHGWINHTTGKLEYLPETAREVAGNKLSNFFLNMSIATMNSTENLMNMGGGFINLLLLPITFSFFAFAVLCLLLGSLFGIQSARTVKAIMAHTKKITEAINPDYEILNREKRSKLKIFFKWVLILLAVLIIIGSILDYTR